MATTVSMPQLGETVTEGTILRWAKQVGDTVAADEVLVEISTDKVDTSAVAGSGDHPRDPRPRGRRVAVGTAMVVIGEAGEKVESTEGGGEEAAEDWAEGEAPAADGSAGGGAIGGAADHTRRGASGGLHAEAPSEEAPAAERQPKWLPPRHPPRRTGRRAASRTRARAVPGCCPLFGRRQRRGRGW